MSKTCSFCGHKDLFGNKEHIDPNKIKNTK